MGSQSRSVRSHLLQVRIATSRYHCLRLRLPDLQLAMMLLWLSGLSIGVKKCAGSRPWSPELRIPHTSERIRSGAPAGGAILAPDEVATKPRMWSAKLGVSPSLAQRASHSVTTSDGLHMGRTLAISGTHRLLAACGLRSGVDPRTGRGIRSAKLGFGTASPVSRHPGAGVAFRRSHSWRSYFTVTFS